VLLVGLLRWWCCGGGRWRCRGSRTAAPSSGAAVSSSGERDSSSSLLSRFLPYSFVFFSGFPFILPVCCQVPYPVSSFSFLSVWVYQWFSFVRFVFFLSSVCSLLSSVHSPFSLFVFYFSPFLPSSFSCSVFVFSLRFPFFVSLFLLALSAVFIGQRGAGRAPTAALSLCVGSDANLPCYGARLGSQRAWVYRACPC